MNYLEDAINQTIEEFDIPCEWNPLIEKELKDIDATSDLDRKDLTNTPFVTIDGEDAKDFDDAVFCFKNKSSFTLKVAIADVASVILPNSEIDKEALKRGTSIYFPRTVIPMLPEKISNNLCSLVPNEKRNVLVCEIIFDLAGKIESYKFYEAYIRSSMRFTYNEIQNYELDDSGIFDLSLIHI